MQRAQRCHSPREAFSGDVNEVTVDGVSGGNVELRERRRDFFQAQAAALGDVESSRQDLGRVFEDAIHFVMVLDEELIPVELHARRIVDRFAGLDAQHDVLRVGVVFAKIVAVVGGDEGQAEIFFQLEQARMDFVFHGEALILNLEIEIFFTENVAIGCSSGESGVVLPFRQTFGDFTFQASRETDQSAGMFCQKILAHAGLVVKAVQMRLRR